MKEERVRKKTRILLLRVTPRLDISDMETYITKSSVFWFVMSTNRDILGKRSRDSDLYFRLG